MEKVKANKTCKVGGRNSSKPCHRRYATEMHRERNRRRRAARAERRAARFLARRQAGKRCGCGRKCRRPHKDRLTC